MDPLYPDPLYPDPLYLGIDTATPYLALALWSPGGGALASYGEEVGRDHAKRLVGELDRLMREAGVKRRELRGVAVGLGPGSYTGLRVGIASAKGLARGLGVPLYGVSTLEAMASSSLATGQTAVVALEAGRGRVYAAAFKRGVRGITPLGEISKPARAEIPSLYPGLKLIENQPPDAAYIAAQGANKPVGQVAALYL